jgi:hypothetical protein
MQRVFLCDRAGKGPKVGAMLAGFSAAFNRTLAGGPVPGLSEGRHLSNLDALEWLASLAVDACRGTTRDDLAAGLYAAVRRHCRYGEDAECWDNSQSIGESLARQRDWLDGDCSELGACRVFGDCGAFAVAVSGVLAALTGDPGCWLLLGTEEDAAVHIVNGVGRPGDMSRVLDATNPNGWPWRVPPELCARTWIDPRTGRVIGTSGAGSEGDETMMSTPNIASCAPARMGVRGFGRTGIAAGRSGVGCACGGVPDTSRQGVGFNLGNVLNPVLRVVAPVFGPALTAALGPVGAQLANNVADELGVDLGGGQTGTSASGILQGIDQALAGATPVHPVTRNKLFPDEAGRYRGLIDMYTASSDPTYLANQLAIRKTQLKGGPADTGNGWTQDLAAMLVALLQAKLDRLRAPAQPITIPNNERPVATPGFNPGAGQPAPLPAPAPPITTGGSPAPSKMGMGGWIALGALAVGVLWLVFGRKKNTKHA